MNLGIVIIGRNEGERLRRCLASLVGGGRRVVYVDSGSTDGSTAAARAAGAEVVQLTAETVFTAARARNEGLARLLATEPELQYVQFVDGDCEVCDGWLRAATEALDARADVVAVCGRLRERFPERSVYNRLCDLEWNGPTGDVSSCGGIAMYRVRAIERAGGFNPDVSAGEEPELCLRLRRNGGTIIRLQQDMAWHDAAMTKFAQWWKRSLRGGQAYAQAMAMHGGAPARFGVRQSAGIWFWSVCLPAATLVGGVFLHPACYLTPLLYFVLMTKIGLHRLTTRREPIRYAALYAFFCVLGKWPQVVGQVRFWARLCAGRRPAVLVEYKSVSVGAAGPGTLQP